jgi:hypothetical protein
MASATKIASGNARATRSRTRRLRLRPSNGRCHGSPNESSTVRSKPCSQPYGSLAFQPHGRWQLRSGMTIQPWPSFRRYCFAGASAADATLCDCAQPYIRSRSRPARCFLPHDAQRDCRTDSATRPRRRASPFCTPLVRPFRRY